jgi:Ca2+/Na+ antiporter
MRNTLIIILAVCFISMLLLIDGNFGQKIIGVLFGICLVSFAYVATKSEKNRKKYSERGLARYRSYRVFYATVVISVIISGISIIIRYLIFDPTWSEPFEITFFWIIYFIIILACSFLVVKNTIK